MTLIRTTLTKRRLWSLLAVPMLLVAPGPVVAEDVTCTVCSCNGDRNGDGTVTVDEVVGAINNLMEGCPALAWQPGCPPPVGHGTDPCPEGTYFCTSETLTAPCSEAGASCCVPNTLCTGTRCDARLVCATQPPAHCPISRRAYKRDIEYLDHSDVDTLRKQLLAFKLARYRYTHEGQSAQPHLGIIIDDIEPSAAVGPSGNTVDLYGYLSMAVATVQAQSKDIEALQRDVDDLRQQLDGFKAPAAEQSKPAN